MVLDKKIGNSPCNQPISKPCPPSVVLRSWVHANNFANACLKHAVAGNVTKADCERIQAAVEELLRDASKFGPEDRADLQSLTAKLVEVGKAGGFDFTLSIHKANQLAQQIQPRPVVQGALVAAGGVVNKPRVPAGGWSHQQKVLSIWASAADEIDFGRKLNRSTMTLSSMA